MNTTLPIYPGVAQVNPQDRDLQCWLPCKGSLRVGRRRSLLRASVSNQLAFIYLTTHNYDAAELALVQAINVHAKEELARYYLGDLYWRKGEQEAAIAQWKLAGTGGLFWQRTLAA